MRGTKYIISQQTSFTVTISTELVNCIQLSMQQMLLLLLQTLTFNICFNNHCTLSVYQSGIESSSFNIDRYSKFAAIILQYQDWNIWPLWRHRSQRQPFCDVIISAPPAMYPSLSYCFLPMGNMETWIFYTTFIPMAAIYLHARTFLTLADTSSIPIRVMYLHARMFCTLVHTTSIPIGAMYLHERTFWTLAHTISIPVGAMYLHGRMFCTLSDTILYPLRAPIFTVITKVWICPC